MRTTSNEVKVPQPVRLDSYGSGDLKCFFGIIATFIFAGIIVPWWFGPEMTLPVAVPRNT